MRKILSILFGLLRVQNLLLSAGTFNNCDTPQANPSCTPHLSLLLSVSPNLSTPSEDLTIADDNTSNYFPTTPVTIQVLKSSSVVNHTLKFLTSVPFSLEEQSIELPQNSTCSDSDLTSGICCECRPSLFSPGTTGLRSNCSPQSEKSTAIYLKPSPIFWDAYEISSSSVSYEIELSISQNGTKPFNKTITISNQNLTNDSNDFNAAIISSNLPQTKLSSLILLKPQDSSNSDPWLAVPADEISADGSECNKIGTKISALKQQPNSCNQPFNSCIQNQISDLLKFDRKLLADKKIAKSLLSRFGNFSFSHDNATMHTTAEYFSKIFFNVELPSSLLTFSTKLGNATISSYSLKEYSPESKTGQLLVTITNTRPLDSSFTLTAKCQNATINHYSLTSNLNALSSSTFNFTFTNTGDNLSEIECLLTLSNSKGFVIDTDISHFSLNSPTSNKLIKVNITRNFQMPKLWEVNYNSDFFCTYVCDRDYDSSCILIFACPNKFATMMATVPIVLAVSVGILIFAMIFYWKIFGMFTCLFGSAPDGGIYPTLSEETLAAQQINEKKDKLRKLKFNPDKTQSVDVDEQAVFELTYSPSTDQYSFNKDLDEIFEQKFANRRIDYNSMIKQMIDEKIMLVVKTTLL